MQGGYMGGYGGSGGSLFLVASLQLQLKKAAAIRNLVIISGLYFHFSIILLALSLSTHTMILHLFLATQLWLCTELFNHNGFFANNVLYSNDIYLLLNFLVEFTQINYLLFANLCLGIDCDIVISGAG
ncbi:hypothetical protein ACJX0J_015848 [Zea mays]